MVINRNGAGSITPPSGWTTLLSAFGGANGDGIVQWFPVTNVSSLPANWSWNATGARQGIVIFRVTGANLSGPGTAGTPGLAGSDGGFALPLVLPGVTAGGAAVAVTFSFWTNFAPATSFVPGFTFLAGTAGTTNGRWGLAVFTELITGATGQRHHDRVGRCWRDRPERCDHRPQRGGRNCYDVVRD